ncbi:MAG: triose-phosphate isomerase [Minisyncoccia bacterium]
MVKPILVANWKNYPSSLEEVKDLLKRLSKDSVEYKKINLFIAPPVVYLESVLNKIKNFGSLAVQDVPLMYEGTHTGELSMHILKSFGVRLSIVGHSERRTLGETNEVINHKIKNILKSGMVPLLCVGEKEKDLHGEHFEFVREQIVACLYKIKKDDVSKIIIAYEPVWTIGKKAKDAMDKNDIEQMIIFIKKILTDLYSRETAEKIKILYGGSVEPANAASILESGVRGFLVGHSSINAENFYRIAKVLNN